MFYLDKAIEKSEDDLINRRDFAYNLARALESMKTNDTFTVGIYGKWGSGKTSVINMTLEKLYQDNIDGMEVIKFEPYTNETFILNILIE